MLPSTKEERREAKKKLKEEEKKLKVRLSYMSNRQEKETKSKQESGFHFPFRR